MGHVESKYTPVTKEQWRKMTLEQRVAEFKKMERIMAGEINENKFSIKLVLISFGLAILFVILLKIIL